MPYEIETIGESQAEEWDGFVTSQPDWTHFHLFGWRRVIGDVFTHRSDYLIARDPSGAPRGVLPLVRVKSLLFGDYMVSMPFLNYGGPLGETPARAALVQRAREDASRSGVDLLELRCREEQQFDMDVSKRKITVLLDIPAAGGETVWRSLPAKVRSQIRRPMKEGVSVRFGPEQQGAFYRVFSRHMRDLGTPTLPLRFFSRALEEFGADMWIGVAYLEAEPIACGCGFRWGSELEMTWASSLRSHSRIAPNMLLYWSFIERAAEAGVSVFNFGRCTPGGSTHRFKQQWGTRDEQLWWYQSSRSGQETTPSQDSRFSLGPRVWRHLPERIATALGPHIVRFIP